MYMWIKINENQGGIYALEAAPDPQKVVSIDELNEQLTDIENRLIIVNAEPDEILMPNDEKMIQQDSLDNEKRQVNELLNILSEL